MAAIGIVALTMDVHAVAQSGWYRGRFITEPLGVQPIGSERSFRPALRTYFVGVFTGTPVNISDLSGVCWLIRGAQNNSFKYCCFLFNSVYLQLIASV